LVRFDVGGCPVDAYLSQRNQHEPDNGGESNQHGLERPIFDAGLRMRGRKCGGNCGHDKSPFSHWGVKRGLVAWRLLDRASPSRTLVLTQVAYNANIHAAWHASVRSLRPLRPDERSLSSTPSPWGAEGRAQVPDERETNETEFASPRNYLLHVLNSHRVVAETATSGKLRRPIERIARVTLLSTLRASHETHETKMAPW
jgi:hypothetical protein